MRAREDTEKQLNGQIFGLENALRKLVNEEVNVLRNSLDLNKKESSDFLNRLKRLETDLAEKNAYLTEDYRKSSKKSSTCLTLENKEVLVVREP